MRIKRETLLEDLEMVKPGLSAREFIEQSSKFVFEDGTVMTFNDEIACRKKLDLGFTGAIRADLLLDILNKMDDDFLMIEESGEGIEFRGKRKRFTMNREVDIHLPISKVETPEKWHSLSKEFIEAVGLVRRCVSKDDNKFLLTCIHLAPDFIEASDNLQIMRVKIDTHLKKSVLVRGTSIHYITAMAMDKIALTPTWIHFKNQAGLILSCRRYNDNYHNLDPYLEMGPSDKFVMPKGMKEASERASVFATDKSGEPTVTVFLKPNKLKIQGEGLSGRFEELKKVTYEGKAFDFVINPWLLSHIIEHYAEADINQDKLRVKGGSWVYIVALGDKEDETPKGEDEDSED